MLRVGLTGGLGSGKSTVARLFASRGVHVLEADQIGRELMQPGQPLYEQVLAHFSQYPDAPPLLLPDRRMDAAALAHYVFSTKRLEELNRIVHPAAIAEQQRRMDEIFRSDPDAIVMVESALIFEADRAGTAPGLRRRFDKLILVTAPEDLRLSRYIARVSEGRDLTAKQRAALEADGRRRMSMQIRDEEKIPDCDFVIENSGPMEQLEIRVEEILAGLRECAARENPPSHPQGPAESGPRIAVAGQDKKPHPRS